MAEILQSLLSVQSVALESNISILSVGAHQTPSSSSSSSSSSISTPSPPPTPSSKPVPVSTSTSTISRKSSIAPRPHVHPSTSTPSVPSPTHSASASPVSKASKGTSHAVIAVMVVLAVAAVLGLSFLVWYRRHAQRKRRAQSGVWLEGPSYRANKQDIEATRSSPTYIPAGMTDGQKKDKVEKEDHRVKDLPLPPAPKEDEEEFTPYSETSAFPLPPSTPNSFVHNFPQTTHPGGQTDSALVYPASATVHPGSQPRPESGPILLYSTPRDQDYAFGSVPPPTRPLSPMSHLPYSPVSQNLDGAKPPTPSSPISPTYSMAPAPAVLPVPMPVSVTRAASPVGPAGTIGTPHPIPPNAYPVIRTYIPSLLDELRVSVGDVVRVIKEYDDGWAHCERIGDPDGTAGVVPLECLDRSGVGPLPSNLTPPSPNDQGSARTSSRISSFHIDFDSMRSSPVGP